MDASSNFIVDRNANKIIIEKLFGDESKIPIADVKSYELPTSFWRSTESVFEDHKQNKYDIDLFNRFQEDICVFDSFLEDAPIPFSELLGKHLGITEKESIEQYYSKPEDIERLAEFNDIICDYYRKNGHRIKIDKFLKNEKSKFSNFKREFVRDQYLEWDTLLTDDFYKNDSEHIEYPALMIDRISLQVYSKEYLTFKSNVKKAIRNTMHRFQHEVEIERYMRHKNELSNKGYSIEDIEDYAYSCLPADLEEEYDFMKHRSILPDYNLTSVPKAYKDSYLWETEGVTYRFRNNPPKGAPVSLFIYANLQRIVYKKMKEDIPEVEEAFNNELLDENNFIPIGYEKEYQKYEFEALQELKHKAKKAYYKMLEREGFEQEEIRKAPLEFNISQIEICWNTPLPLDPIKHMKKVMDNYHSYNLMDSSFHDNTPLLVTKYMSDIEPNTTRFSHKIYKKTKKNLRNEIVLGNELKLSADIGNGRKPIYAQFFIHPEQMKRYMYAKLTFHFTRRTSGFDKEKYQHGYHQWTRMNSEVTDDDQKQYLTAYLQSTELHESFKDISFFNNLVNELRTKGFVTRKFFHPWSNRFFDKNVSKSDDFERMKRGRYRVRHGSYLEDIMTNYMKFREIVLQPVR